MNPKNASDVRAIANRCAAQLQRCRPGAPTSHSLARAVHAHLIVSGLNPGGHILNRLIGAYCKSSNISYARHLFDGIPQPDVVARTTLIAAYAGAGGLKLARDMFDATPLGVRDTVCYNAMITGYCHNNDGHAAVGLFLDMRRHGFKPDDYTYTAVLAAVSLIANGERHCHQMHCTVVKSGTGCVTSVVNALISVYVKCASSPLVSSPSLMGAARRLFNEMPQRDDLTWTTIIAGYVRNHDLDAGREFLDAMTENSGVACNAMISGYVHHGRFDEALDLFRKMHLLDTHLDEFTFTSIICACANAGLLGHGKQVHAYILKTESSPTQHFSLSVNNSLITLYMKFGKFDEAREVFNAMPVRDIVSWNAVLSGYVNERRLEEARSLFSEMPERNLLTWTVIISGLAQNGFGEEGLKMFNQMKLEGLEPCDYAFAGAIACCAVLGALEHGRQLHAQVVSLGHDSSLSAGNALITMYARGGVVEAAHRVFLTMPFLDSVSWNAMIAALGQHGHSSQAIELFDEMLEEDIVPDRISFLTVLSACSHGGLVKEGRRYFDIMRSVYSITPGEDHYARLIDLLSRAGRFHEAKEVIESMPSAPGAPIWESFLSGCRIHNNMDLGIEAAEKLFKLVPQHDGTYILLSNMYANAGHWDQVAEVRKLMRERGVKKEPGCSWIEVESKVHVFLVNDARHPEAREIYIYLEELGLEMRKLGFVPDTKHVLHDMEAEHKEHALATHSEKLAVAYGLMRLPRGATVRVFKNLRICGDCHSAFKFMSKVVGREIVVRDGKRFHHFKDGECSCGNFW